MTELVPEGQAWLVLACVDGRPDAQIFSAPSRAACLDFISQCRDSGDTSTFFIYAPSSCHKAELKDKVQWQAK